MSELITVAYAVANAIGLYAYWPQIRLLLVTKGKAKDIALQTWAIWSANAVIIFLYASLNMQDVLFSIVAGVDALLIGMITCLTLARRHLSSLQGYAILPILERQCMTAAE